jgi:hypothetical protein
MPAPASSSLITFGALLTIIVAALVFYIVATWHDVLYTYYVYKTQEPAGQTPVPPAARLPNACPSSRRATLSARCISA